jgi:hypothetical protein
MRRCGLCNEFKPVSHFAWRRQKKGQRDNYCRPCRAAYHRAHYLTNKQRYIDNAGDRRRRVVAENTEKMLVFLSTHPCVDCGETDPIVLEFDHIADKSFTIAAAMRFRGWDAIEREMEQCEVVCANCHRRRTATRGGFARAAHLDARRQFSSDCRVESNPSRE